MRITLVSPNDPASPSALEAAEATVGGVERAVGRLAAELAGRGHEVTLLCSTRGPPGAAFEGGMRVIRVRRRAAALGAPLADLAGHLPREAELVHVPATLPFLTGPVLRGAKRLGQRAVLDFHHEPCPPGAAGAAAIRVWGAWGPRSYASADAVLVPSLASAGAAPSLRGLEARWRIVPNGVDTRRFHPRGPARDGAYLLAVARLVPHKGLGVLLQALTRLPAPPPLLVAGDGPERGRLEAAAQALGVDATFLGHVPDAALPTLYRGARLTVLPSVTRLEASGVALVESMACGTPVVASDLPGVAQVASLGGLVAPPGDPAGLAAALTQALEGGLPRGEALAARVRARFDGSAVTDRILAVYHEVLGTPPARGQEVTPLAHPRRDSVL